MLYSPSQRTEAQWQSELRHDQPGRHSSQGRSSLTLAARHKKEFCAQSSPGQPSPAGQGFVPASIMTKHKSGGAADAWHQTFYACTHLNTGAILESRGPGSHMGRCPACAAAPPSSSQQSVRDLHPGGRPTKAMSSAGPEPTHHELLPGNWICCSYQAAHRYK